MLALTRKIFADEAGEDSVEDVFARAQQVMAKAEALLVDAGWSAPKPVAVEVTARWRQRSRRGCGARRSLFSAGTATLSASSRGAFAGQCMAAQAAASRSYSVGKGTGS